MSKRIRKHLRSHWKLKSLLALVAVAGIHCSTFSPKRICVPRIVGAKYVGDRECIECHDDTGEAFRKTVHARIPDFKLAGSVKGCEACHGAGSLHCEQDEPDTTTILAFGELTAGQRSAVCLQCHTRFHWQACEHSLSDVDCTACHKTHSSNRKLLVDREPKLCYKCHAQVKAKSYYPSRHPIREGKMVCTSCHNPHGSEVGDLKTEERLNDLCLKCHAAKQGPFVFEHEPVVEKCTICHDAHGSVANNLLRRNEPFLCLQCHQFHFHAAKDGFAGTYTSGVTGRTTTSASHSYKLAYTKKCTQCHSQIHGSDSPSMSVPGRGRALTR